MNTPFSLDLQSTKICVCGLGYVGLPLAVEFGKHFPTIGFDLNIDRIRELKKGQDSTLEVDSDELRSSKHLRFTFHIADAKDANVYIVTVPTPVDEHKRPDLNPLLKASGAIGSVITKGDLVIYESTVYPGATEEDCIPVIERYTGLRLNHDFYAGYSPERINPGDKSHRLTNIKKVTSGSTPEAADFVDRLYGRIVSAGTFKASSIRVAEAAKVIENTQRDLNIALVNELALIFNKMGIDTSEVLAAAGTKWNFLPFKPGLVGGHCIGVDPYYLTHKAQEIGYTPEVILAGRRINDSMGPFVVAQVVKKMLNKRLHVKDSSILILGLTFKENCPDIRNTRVIDLIKEFREYGANVDVYDPWVNPEDAKHEYRIELIETLATGKYDGIVIAVAHKQFVEMGIETIRAFGKPECVIYDIKSVFPKESTDGRL